MPFLARGVSTACIEAMKLGTKKYMIHEAIGTASKKKQDCSLLGRQSPG